MQRLIAFVLWSLCPLVGFAAEPEFRIHVLNPESEFSSAAVFDVDHDGDLDIFSGGFWYEAPGWQKHFVRDVENIGGRFDKYVGSYPDQTRPGGTFVGTQSYPGKEVINQNIAVWRAGATYDLTGSGRTAVKFSASRYGLQVGIDRVTNVNPMGVGSADCPWTDPNGNRKYDVGEINLATCPAFSGGSVTGYDPGGVDWPYFFA